MAVLGSGRSEGLWGGGGRRGGGGAAQPAQLSMTATYSGQLGPFICRAGGPGGREPPEGRWRRPLGARTTSDDFIWGTRASARRSTQSSDGSDDRNRRVLVGLRSPASHLPLSSKYGLSHPHLSATHTITCLTPSPHHRQIGSRRPASLLAFIVTHSSLIAAGAAGAAWRPPGPAIAAWPLHHG